MNILDDWDLIAVLLMTLPGKTCESIGTRLGIVTRKFFGVSIEGLKHAKNVIENWDKSDFIPEEYTFDDAVCEQFCQRVPWHPDYVVEDQCPTKCMLRNPNWRKEYDTI